MEISENKKSNKLLIFGLVLLVILIFGAVGYSAGKKEVKDEENNAPKEVKEVIEKKSTYEEINTFFNGTPDKDIKYLTQEETKKVAPSYEANDGGECNISNIYTKYGDHYVFFKSETCRNTYEITIFKDKEMLLEIKNVYSKITFKDSKRTVITKPFIRNGKVFYIADGNKESGTTIFAYVDLKDKIEEVEVNDLEVTH